MMYSRGKNRQEMIRYKSGKADSSKQLIGHSREAFPALVTKTVSADTGIAAAGSSFAMETTENKKTLRARSQGCRRRPSSPPRPHR